MEQLKREYGAPRIVKIEATKTATSGIVWMEWGALRATQNNPLPSRNLFIHPDGSRLSWTTI